MGEERREHCKVHEDNTTAIAKHSGQWRMLLLILTASLGGLFYLQLEIQASANKIENTVIAYIASDTVETREGVRRITKLEEIGTRTEHRLDRLESYHVDIN